MEEINKPFYISSSKIAGNGLFASRQLPKGEFLFEVTGQVIEHKYEPNFSSTGPNWMGFGINKWIKTDENHPWTKLNHSCDPNVGFAGDFRIVTIRDVQPGEELTIDYAITDADPYWSMDCACGSSNCRKNIYGFTHLSDDLKRKYADFIPNWMQQFMTT